MANFTNTMIGLQKLLERKIFRPRACQQHIQKLAIESRSLAIDEDEEGNKIMLSLSALKQGMHR